MNSFDKITRLRLSVLFILTCSFLFFANLSSADICGEETETTLFAGQTIDVGTVSASNDDTYLYVTYKTTRDWSITETHVDVATTPKALKQTKKGNAIPGRFAYSSTHNPGVTEVTHTIDLSQWPVGTQLYIAAHCVVTSPGGSESAWADGPEFPGKNWATYFGYTVQICEDPVFPGIIEFSEPYVDVDEFFPVVHVTLIRSNGSDGDAYVDLSSTDITATDGDDYNFVSLTVHFADGETSKQITVFILDDSEEESDEMFALNLSNVVGAQLGTQTSMTVNIIDDDGVNPD